MRTILKISKRLDTLTQENLLMNRRLINFNRMTDDIWKGTKRYAH
ncbi:hypothetical protein [Yeosuana sp.]